MKKYIFISFTVIFGLFTIGAAVSIYQLLTTTANLRYLIDLHEIEDIRQELFSSFQKIQNYTYASADSFTKNLDEVIANAEVVNHTVKKCHECHHEPAVQTELDQVEAMIKDYEEKLSYLITTVSEGERREDYQKKVARSSDLILDKVHAMVDQAAKTITVRTDQAMFKIEQSYVFMALTLLFTIITSLFVARSLTRGITRPIDELLKAADALTAGDLGYQMEHKSFSEFNNLFNHFNQMSVTLSARGMKIKNNLARIDQLNLVTLPLHTAQDMEVMKKYLRTSMNALISVAYNGIMLANDPDHFEIQIFCNNDQDKSTYSMTLDREEVEKVFREHHGHPLLINNADNFWPFKNKPASFYIQNLLVLWLTSDDSLTGALLVINRDKGNFLEEDLNILGILANNIAVALQNIRLYHDLQSKIDELKNAQHQLIEAEKLTALGTLAGGVAHDFNNILCGMIGYVALLKRNHSPEDHDYKMLETIEKAGFRASTLTKQLLTFARQEKVDKIPTDINNNVRNVIDLLANTISKLIIIKEELAESLPLVHAAPAQLEQVIMNLCVNARDAMPEGGELRIATEKVELGLKFCHTHTGAMPGTYVRLTIADQGHGIEQEDLPRVFEPFFTTKEFGKGTGLGLAMVYGIVKSHNGFCDIDTAPNEGTTFSLYLPVLDADAMPASVEDEIVVATVSGHTILIVDDEELIAETLYEHLKDEGNTVLLANNGRKALEVLIENRETIDLVILDINMPVMSGKEAFDGIMKIKPDIKVLIATGYDLQGKAEEIMDRGAHGFIQKPYSLEEINAKIQEVMKG